MASLASNLNHVIKVKMDNLRICDCAFRPLSHLCFLHPERLLRPEWFTANGRPPKQTRFQRAAYCIKAEGFAERRYKEGRPDMRESPGHGV